MNTACCSTTLPWLSQVNPASASQPNDLLVARTVIAVKHDAYTRQAGADEFALQDT